MIDRMIHNVHESKDQPKCLLHVEFNFWKKNLFVGQYGGRNNKACYKANSICKSVNLQWIWTCICKIRSRETCKNNNLTFELPRTRRVIWR